MLKYRSLLFFLPVICVTQFVTDMGSPYVHPTLHQYYNYEKMPPPQEKVDLQVYYECLCPACVYLHKNVLSKLVRELGSYLNFKSHPYGNAQTVLENGRTVVKSQHGEKESYGHKLHACAINLMQDPVSSELFNACMMSAHWGGEGSTDMDAVKCAASMGINAEPIISCARSQRGEDLLQHHGRETAMVNQTYAPYVLINGNEWKQENGDLKTAVCQAFTNPPPPCL